MSHIQTLVILLIFITIGAIIIRIVSLLIFHLFIKIGCDTSALLAFPLCVGALRSLIIEVVAQFPVGQGQVVETGRVAIHVLNLDLEHAHHNRLILEFSDRVATGITQSLSNNILRWVVVDHFLILACHADFLPAVEVFRVCCSALRSPFQLIFGALFLEQRQDRNNFGQHLNILLILHILVNRIALTCLNQMLALFRCEWLKPVAIAGELVGRWRHAIDELADLLVLDAQFQQFKHRVDGELDTGALGPEHVAQKALAEALDDSRLERVGLLVNVRDA